MFLYAPRDAQRDSFQFPTKIEIISSFVMVIYFCSSEDSFTENENHYRSRESDAFKPFTLFNVEHFFLFVGVLRYGFMDSILSLALIVGIREKCLLRNKRIQPGRPKRKVNKGLMLCRYATIT
jgi:hypothetical protein